MGAGGQDGLILTQTLTNRGFEVVGVTSRSRTSMEIPKSFPEIKWTSTQSSGDLPVRQLPRNAEVLINLAGHSSVAVSWEEPSRSMVSDVNVALQAADYCSKTGTPMVFAASSEMFSRGHYTVSEQSSLEPSSPYGVSKAAILQYLRIMRLRGSLQFSALIMFNHESPLRPTGFVTSLMADQICNILSGQQTEVMVGSLKSRKDFSWAPDFVRVMANPKLWSSGKDFVLASGKTTSVEELAATALVNHGLDPSSIFEAPSFSRPFDVHPSGDSSKAKKLLGFKQTVSSRELVSKMVEMQIEVSDLPKHQRKRRLVDELASQVGEL